MRFITVLDESKALNSVKVVGLLVYKKILKIRCIVRRKKQKHPSANAQTCHLLGYFLHCCLASIPGVMWPQPLLTVKCPSGFSKHKYLFFSLFGRERHMASSGVNLLSLQKNTFIISPLKSLPGSFLLSFSLETSRWSLQLSLHPAQIKETFCQDGFRAKI